MNGNTGSGSEEINRSRKPEDRRIAQALEEASGQGRLVKVQDVISKSETQKENKMSEQITIKELGNTWGCVWMDENDKTHYGFNDCPVSARAQLWLDCASGHAVQQLIAVGLATIIETSEGAYGGEKRTVRVNIAALNTTCDKYWDRANAQGREQEPRQKLCHYCGQPASKTGFFGEATCESCS